MSLPASMIAVVARHEGGPGVLRLEELPRPEPGPGQVLLRVDPLRHLLYAPAPNQSLVAFNVGGWFLERPAIAGAALGELVGLVAAGELATPPLQRLALAQAAEAHRRLESRAGSGKIVLKPWLE